MEKSGSPKKINYIDLFSGCGGLSFGFSLTKRFNRLFAVEKDNDAFLTYRKNLLFSGDTSWPDWLDEKNWDIIELLSSHEEDFKTISGCVDLIVGGPPCQGFSFAGKRSHADERNLLPFYYLKAIDLLKPKAIFFENVRGFCVPFIGDKLERISFSDELISDLEKIGYSSHSEILDFSKYGVPQKRERFILFATNKKFGLNPKDFFDKLEFSKDTFLKNKNLKSPITIEDAISDLVQGNQKKSQDERFLYGRYSSPPRNEYQNLMRAGIGEVSNHRFPNHSEKIVERFSSIIRENLSNKEIHERFQIKKSIIQLLDAKKPAPTLTTLPDDYIHYSEPRILTPREYARIQTFPDSFIFYGKYTTGGKKRKSEVPIYTQIGNAVPPLFAELAGIVIGDILDGI